MRITTIAMLLLLLMGAEFTYAASARFYITTKTNNELGQTYMDDFQRQITDIIEQKYPCASIQTRYDVAVLLDRERERQLLGVGKENAVENIGQSMICDFLISLNIQIDNNNANIVAFCANPKSDKVLSRTSAVAKLGEVLESADKVAQQLFDGLKTIEICPYVGPVSINISSELDSSNTLDYGVYCNEADQQFHEEMVIHNTSYSDWKLERKHILTAEGLRVFYAEGTMIFSSTEESKLSEDNGCYKCKSGREGGRTYTETRSMNVKGNGISMKSRVDGKPTNDAYIELKFLENGTYILIATGTSQPTTGIEKIISKAEGTCDNLPQQTETKTREITIPLNVTFGPYEGKATDKVLQQKDSQETINPVTREKSSITIDFTLNRKGQ